MSVSRFRARLPIRESTVFASTPSFVNHQKRSRPSTLWRQWRLARTNRELDGVTGRQFLGDLEAAVATADDQDAAFWHVARSAVARAVPLEDFWCKLRRDLRDSRLVKRTGGDDHLTGHDFPVIELDPEGVIGCGEREHRAVELDREARTPFDTARDTRSLRRASGNRRDHRETQGQEERQNDEA